MSRKPPPRRPPPRAPPPAPRAQPAAPPRNKPAAPPRSVPAAPPRPPQRKPPPHNATAPQKPPPVVPIVEDDSLPLLSKGPRRPFKDLSKESLMGNGKLGPPDVRSVPWKTSPDDLLTEVTVAKGSCYRPPEGLLKYGAQHTAGRRRELELEYGTLLDQWSLDDDATQQRKAKIASFGKQSGGFANELPESYPKQVQSLNKLDWLKKLASNHPLDRLAASVPLYPLHQCLEQLVKEKVPVQRALWFVKVIQLNSGNTQHKTPEDMGKKWWETLRQFLDSFLKLQNLRAGPPHTHKDKWRYVLRLAHASCAEALLDGRTFVRHLCDVLLKGSSRALGNPKAASVVTLVAHSLIWFEEELAREPKLAMELHKGLVQTQRKPAGEGLWGASAQCAVEHLLQAMAAGQLLPHALVYLTEDPTWFKGKNPSEPVLHCSVATEEAIRVVSTRSAALSEVVCPSRPRNIARLLEILSLAARAPLMVLPATMASAVQPLVDDSQLKEHVLTILCNWGAQEPFAAHRNAMVVKVMLEVLDQDAAPVVQKVVMHLLEATAAIPAKFAHVVSLAQGLADCSNPELLSQDLYAKCLISRPQHQKDAATEYTVLRALPLSVSEQRNAHQFQHCRNQRWQLLAERSKNNVAVPAQIEDEFVEQFHTCLLNVAHTLDRSAGVLGAAVGPFTADLLERGLERASEQAAPMVQIEQLPAVLTQLPIFYLWQLHQWLAKIALVPEKRTPKCVKVVLKLLLESGHPSGAARGVVAALQSVSNGSATAAVLLGVVLQDPNGSALLQDSDVLLGVLHAEGLLSTVVTLVSEQYCKMGNEPHDVLQLLIKWCRKSPQLLEAVCASLQAPLKVMSENKCKLSVEDFRNSKKISAKQQDVNAQISALFQIETSAKQQDVNDQIETVVQNLLTVMSCAQDLGLAMRLCLSKLVTSKNAANLIERCGEFLVQLQARVMSTQSDWQRLPHAPMVLAVVRHVVLPMASNATVDDTKETAGVVTKLIEKLLVTKYLDADSVAHGLVAPALSGAATVRDAAVYGPLCSELCAKMLSASPGELWAVQQGSREALATAATNALRLTKDAATSISQAQSHPRWTLLREAVFGNRQALQCVLCKSSSCWIEVGLVEPREAITKLLGISSANVTRTAVLREGLKMAGTAWRVSEASTSLHMAILYAPQFGSARASPKEADQTAAELLTEVQRQMAQGHLGPFTAAELCEQLCSRVPQVVEKLQDVLLSEEIVQGAAQLAKVRGVSESVIHHEWLEWASACAARVAKNGDVSIIIARGLANQLQQLVEKLQKPEAPEGRPIQAVGRLLHLAAPLHEVYCEMPSKCKCNELVSALLRLLPFCLENLIVAQLVHDLVVSIFTTGAHLHDHTARWREVADKWGQSEDLLLRHLHMILTPRSLLQNGHNRFNMYPEPSKWMNESVEIASRNNTWQVLPGYPYRNDGIAVIVHQNKLKRKWDDVCCLPEETVGADAEAV